MGALSVNAAIVNVQEAVLDQRTQIALYVSAFFHFPHPISSSTHSYALLQGIAFFWCFNYTACTVKVIH